MTGQELVLDLLGRGHTKVYIANAIGVLWETVYDWTTGQEEPTPEQHALLEALAKR